MTEIHTIQLIGKPGSGKGTVAKMLGWRSCGSGDYFRSLAERQNQMGALVREQLGTGTLLPSFFITRLYLDTLETASPAENIIFDGLARTVGQAREADQMLTWFKRRYLVIYLHADDRVVEQRLIARSKVQQRLDSDTQEKIDRRLRDYHRVTAPVLEYYVGNRLLREVNAECSLEQTLEAVRAHLR